MDYLLRMALMIDTALTACSAWRRSVLGVCQQWEGWQGHRPSERPQSRVRETCANHSETENLSHRQERLLDIFARILGDIYLEPGFRIITTYPSTMGVAAKVDCYPEATERRRY